MAWKSHTYLHQFKSVETVRSLTSNRGKVMKKNKTKTQFYLLLCANCQSESIQRSDISCLQIIEIANKIEKVGVV